MDKRLDDISIAIREINRNLFLLQGDIHTSEKSQILESALKAINNFEKLQMHAVRCVLEIKGPVK